MASRATSWLSMDLKVSHGHDLHPEHRKKDHRRKRKKGAETKANLLPTDKLKAGDCGKSGCCGATAKGVRLSRAREKMLGEKERERGGGGRRLAVMRDREAKQVCLKLALRLTEHAVAENCRWHKQRAVWLHCQKRKPLRWCKSCIQHNFHLPSSVCRSFHLLPPGLTLTNKLPR